MQKYTGWIIAGVVGLFVLFGIGQWMSAASLGNRLEQGIKARYEDNQNVLSNTTNVIMETAQVPAMAREDLKEVINTSLQARYGANGAQATFNWIKENYPGSVDPQLYRRIQDVIESGRRDFSTAQTQLIDQKRVYETNLGSPWTGFWLRLAGYPKINLDDYKIVINDRTAEAFRTGRENPIQLAPAN